MMEYNGVNNLGGLHLLQMVMKVKLIKDFLIVIWKFVALQSKQWFNFTQRKEQAETIDARKI